MRAAWTTAGAEPALDDMLSDPIVALVMRRDRIVAGDVLRAVQAARRRLAAPEIGERPRVPADVDG